MVGFCKPLAATQVSNWLLQGPWAVEYWFGSYFWSWQFCLGVCKPVAATQTKQGLTQHWSEWPKLWQETWKPLAPWRLVAAGPSCPWKTTTWMGYSGLCHMVLTESLWKPMIAGCCYLSRPHLLPQWCWCLRTNVNCLHVNFLGNCLWCQLSPCNCIHVIVCWGIGENDMLASQMSLSMWHGIKPFSLTRSM